jgi:hypothetical protein
MRPLFIIHFPNSFASILTRHTESLTYCRAAIRGGYLARDQHGQDAHASPLGTMSHAHGAELDSGCNTV